MITRRFVLFIGRILLLVHNYQPDVIKRRKQRRPRTDYDTSLAPAHPDHRIIALRQRQAAVHDHNIIREITFKGHHYLTCQRDFRHQYDDLPSCRPDLGRHFHINLRLAAARYPFKQKTMILLG